jgi:hypothetical protein
VVTSLSSPEEEARRNRGNCFLVNGLLVSAEGIEPSTY